MKKIIEAIISFFKSLIGFFKIKKETNLLIKTPEETVSAKNKIEPIDSIDIKSGEHKISLNRISELIIGNRAVSVKIKKEDFLKNLLPQIGVDIAVISNLNAVYTTKATPELLMHLTSGGYSSALIQNGHIVGHQGFIQVSPMSVFTPILAFQIMSAITGQYYLNNMSQQINKIQTLLNQLIAIHHNKSFAILKNATNKLDELLKMESNFPEDADTIGRMKESIDNIIAEYEGLIMAIDSNIYKATKNKYTNAKKQLDAVCDIVNSDNPYLYSSILDISTTLSFYYSVADLKVQSHLCKIDSTRIIKMKELHKKVDEYQTYRNDFLDKIHESILGTIGGITVIKFLPGNQEKLSQAWSKYKEYENTYNSLRNESSNNLSQIKVLKETVSSFMQKEITLIFNVKEDVVEVFVERDSQNAA